MTCRPLNYPFPVQRWRRPSPELLAGERSIGGPPPFNPFLTATMLWEAHLCPVAAIHELLHGLSIRLGDRSHPGRSPYFLSGEAWHRYIARLRLRIASGQLPLPGDVGHALAIIRHDFEEWAEGHVSYPDRDEIWRGAVEPYVRTRLHRGQLAAIVGHALLPEVTVGNAHVEIPLDSGGRRYPIEARIDELNLTIGAAIERTSLDTNSALPHKMIQLAVIAAILRSLPAAGIPQQWSAVRQVHLFLLETPTDTIVVNPASHGLNDAIHEAAAIIRDIAASELTERAIRQQAQCTPYSAHDICSHPYLNCFYNVPTHPRARIPINRNIRTLCRAELYELLWQRDLAKYRLYSPGIAGNAYPGLLIDILRTGRDAQGRSFVEARLVNGGLPGIEYATLIVGTPFLGVRHEGRIEEDQSTGTFRVYCDVIGLPLRTPGSGVLWPAVDQGFLLENVPYFLIRNRQRQLFTLRRIGTDNLQVAQQEAVLQLLESVFGGTPSLET